MRRQKIFRILVLLGYLACATSSDAQVGRFVRVARSNIKTKLSRIIMRDTTTPRRPVINTKKGFHFKAGKRLPVVSPQTGGILQSYSAIPKAPHEMYRGMLLDANGQQLRYILRNGLETAKSFSLLRKSYDGKIYPPDTKAVFASTWLAEAVCYANPYYQKDPKLAVVFHLKQVGTSSLVQVPHDIPPSWIHQVSAWLEIEGKPRWGALKLDKNDNLIFIPYPEQEILPKIP